MNVRHVIHFKLTKMLSLRRKSKTLNDVLVAHCSTNAKFVNHAKSGKANFTKEFSQNHIETSSFQKLLLGLGSGLMSITDPRRGDMVAVMGESTGAGAFEYIRSKMMQSEEGRQVLEDKPRISSATVDLEKLKSLPEGTLGKAYSNFLEKYKYTPDERLAVRFVDDFELAYVAQRYREVHDLFHTILDMPTNMLGEVTVKWVEAIQTRLPMCVTGALFGPIRLAPKFTRTYSTQAHFVLDPGVRAGLEDKKFRPKNHPGKIKMPHTQLPEELQERIFSLLKERDAFSYYGNVKNFRINLYKKLLPIEGIRKEVLMASKRNSILKRLQEKNKRFWDADRLEKILSEKLASYEKLLKHLSTPLKFDNVTSLTYLMARAPFEYSALLRVFKELKKKDQNFQPRTLFDFGSGTGTVVWAASRFWHNSIEEYYTVDASGEMNDLARNIIQPENKPPLVKGLVQKQFLPGLANDFDIVISSFTFLHLINYEDRMTKLNYLWNKTSKYLVFVENGTKDGFIAIEQIRDMILRQSISLGFRCHVVAPCPHDLQCPLSISPDRKPCNFLTHYRDLKFSKNDEIQKTPYCYVIFGKNKRNENDEQWPRVVGEVLPRDRHVHCELCTAHGTLVPFVFTKRKTDKWVYKCSRLLTGGDCFPGKVCESLEMEKKEGNESDSSSSSDDDS